VFNQLIAYRDKRYRVLSSPAFSCAASFEHTYEGRKPSAAAFRPSSCVRVPVRRLLRRLRATVVGTGRQASKKRRPKERDFDPDALS